MSDEQSDGAIMVVANYLFGRKEFGEWKQHVANEETTNNTLPAHSNRRRVEAMALSLIVEELMSGSACVVYSNDESVQSGVGNYVVQSIFVNGIQRNLPTFGVFTEKRETSADLIKCTLAILSASPAYKYSTQDILKKIEFVMSDSTSHNLQVMEKLC